MKYDEKDETPKMEAKAHSKGFMKKAMKMKSAKKMPKK